MDAIDRLRRDHSIMRAKADALESAVRMGPETWLVLRDMSYSLLRKLRDHIQQEEALVDSHCPDEAKPSVQRVVEEHRAVADRLRAVGILLLNERACPFEDIRSSLTAFIRALRTHLNDEEATLFPLVQVDAPRGEDGSATIDETRTVNAVMREHPGIDAAFRRLGIDALVEGSDCLDEVAWRHGMTSEALLARLAQEAVRGE